MARKPPELLAVERIKVDDNIVVANEAGENRRCSELNSLHDDSLPSRFRFDD